MHLQLTDCYLAQQGISRNLISKFWERVQKTETCWLWTRGKTKFGHGRIWIGGGELGAHVFSWIIHFGPIPKGFWVLHNCPGIDMPHCVNPTHLYLGTAFENRLDSIRKGTSTKIGAWGELNGRNKLSAEQVQEIRSIVILNRQHRLAVAMEYQIDESTIRQIQRGKTWRRLPA